MTEMLFWVEIILERVRKVVNKADRKGERIKWRRGEDGKKRGGIGWNPANFGWVLSNTCDNY